MLKSMLNSMMLFQSTHPRRVRLFPEPMTPHILVFQSTHPRRVRRAQVLLQVHQHKFQSTHPRRVRRWIYGNCKDQSYFNPHTREGCDGIFSLNIRNNQNFNPHTREGCDQLIKGLIDNLNISIHTPAKGATRCIY